MRTFVNWNAIIRFGGAHKCNQPVLCCCASSEVGIVLILKMLLGIFFPSLFVVYLFIQNWSKNSNHIIVQFNKNSNNEYEIVIDKASRYDTSWIRWHHQHHHHPIETEKKIKWINHKTFITICEWRQSLMDGDLLLLT